MKRLFALVTLLIGLAVPWGTNAAEPAGEITTDDAKAIHSVVQSQLDALAEDDAASAFDLTTPDKKMQIGSPDNFLRMMKEQYDPIYRHRLAIFSTPQVVNGDAIQVVRLTDGYSHVWIAIFWMQREDDRSWKIDGCHLLETATISI